MELLKQTSKRLPGWIINENPRNTCQYNVMMNNSSLDFQPRMTYTANTIGNKNKCGRQLQRKLSGKKDKGANYARHTGIKNVGLPSCRSKESLCILPHCLVTAVWTDWGSVQPAARV